MTHRSTASKTRSDNHLSIKNSESFDTYIQNTLSALYPPFKDTAATVLWQLFHVVEKSYQGDGLRCLIDFLVPAKRILQRIQRDTCARYAGVIFRHEGWPLCVHEKVVVQLTSLHKVPLKAGDFYIQVAPQGNQSVKLVLKCLSANGQSVEEVPVPEDVHAKLFTAEFLENVSRERECSLHSCLLTSGTVVLRVRWENVINPVFVNRPKTEPANSHSGTNRRGQAIAGTEKMPQMTKSNNLPDHCSPTEALVPVEKTAISEGKMNCGILLSENMQPFGTRIKLESARGLKEGDSSFFCPSADSTDVIPLLSLAQPTPLPDEAPTVNTVSLVVPSPETRITAKVLTFATDLSSPCQKRKQRRDSMYLETRRLFRKSYMEALQNPMQLGFNSEESIAEEVMEHKTEVISNGNLRIFTKRHGEKMTQKHDPHVSSWESKGVTDGAKTTQICQGPVGPVTLQDQSSAPSSRICRRRSKSLDMAYKSFQDKALKTRFSSGDSSRKKVSNGHVVEMDKLSSDSYLTDGGSTLKAPAGCSQSSVAGTGRRGSCHTVLTQTLETAETTPSPACPQTTVQVCSSLPGTAAEVNLDLLHSGIAQLPGNRDKVGRAVIQIWTHNIIWLNQSYPSMELTNLLGYYFTIPRKEVRELGLTILVDARRCPPAPTLFKAFTALQIAMPNSINLVLVLVERESTFRPERDPFVQHEVVTTLKALHRHIDGCQLTQEFSGTFPHDHNDWIRFHMKLEPFMKNCRGALIYLKNSINSLNVSRIPSTAQEVIELLNQHTRIMKCVLEDSRLVGLRLEGGTVLARIRKDEFCDTDDYRNAMETVTMLYNQVDEEVHKLVKLSNECLQHLQLLLGLKKIEEGSAKIQHWAESEGKKHFDQIDCLPHSLEALKEKQEEYNAFYSLAVQHYKRGMQLIKDAGHLNNQSHNELLHLEHNELLDLEEIIKEFKQFLNNFISKLEKQRTDMDNIVNLYEFYETADQWILHCSDYLRQLKVSEQSTLLDTTTMVQNLGRYHQEATKFNAENFETLNEMVHALGSARELKQWNVQWMKCQQTRHLLEEVLAAALRVQESQSNNLGTTAHSEDEGPRTSGEFDTEGSDELGDSPSQKGTETLENGVWPDGTMHLQKDGLDFMPSNGSFTSGYKELGQNGDPSYAGSTTPPSSAPACSRTQGTEFYFKDMDSCTESSSATSCHSEPPSSPGPRHKKQPLKKIMRKTQSAELWQRENSPSEAGWHGNTGIYIKGLEVVSSVVADKNRIPKSELNSLPLIRRHSLSGSSRIHHSQTQESKNAGSKLQHIMEEMIGTEREYVKSLGYIIDYYFPEMDRNDLPQDLRGKRNTIFGNLEKLYDFHCQHFLKELEQCTNSPLRVSHCFLRHEEQFRMYALYSMNKPRSDGLLASHGNTFFKNKQLALGDKMDLASYLLKPIQRMSKYALLLKDMIKHCSKAQEQEFNDLQAAEEMVKFQLRHGNDLLAMDAIRGCDVNLQEQGQLMCQEEFVVWCGRKKYLRHIFLFEDLILFSKTKKIEGGYDIYVYKQSFKTAEIGMTENVGESGLRFEIWFRRRKSQDTYIFQASSSEVKLTWTNVIGKILWRQALRNREVRMQEMVSMGIGNKPFMDIKPSEAAISDHAIDYIMKGTETRTRASIAVSSFDHSISFKRPHSTISNSSTSSSSSQSSCSILGTLNLHVYSCPMHAGLLHVTPFNQWSSDIGTCIEEDELEQDAGSQPSIITESSETSSLCTSAESISGSTLSYVHQLSTETFPDEAPNPDSNKACLYSSPNLSPKMQAKNQYITACKVSHVSIGFSTLV